MKNLKRNLYYKKIGIYCIKSLIDDKIYIGSSSCLYSRINYHLNNLRNNKHSNKKLQNYYNKYGEESLEIKILKLIDNELDLVKLEKELIDNQLIENLLNIELNPLDPNRKKASLETKEKLKKSWKENRSFRLKSVNENLIKAKLSGYKPDGSNWQNKKHKESSKVLMSISAKKRGYVSGLNVKVSRYNKNNEYIDSFESIRKASLICFGSYADSSNITSVCNNKRKYCKGFIFKKDLPK